MALKFNPLIFSGFASSGPAIPPSSVAGSGTANHITFWSGTSTLTSSSDFQIDDINKYLKLGNADIGILQSHAIGSGVHTGTLLFNLPLARNFASVEYSIEKGGAFRVGKLLIAHDGTTVIVSDMFQEIGTTGVELSSNLVTHTISGSSVQIRYNSAGGSAGNFKRLTIQWS
jgi:hypothetical protein